jgi:V-type H+-transporting ATPase 16kDa proteolipid subunit
MEYATTIIDTTTTTASQCSAIFYGLTGAASALILSSIGAAYGSSKPNIFHSQSSSSSSSSINKQLPEWENAPQYDSSSFNIQNKSKLSAIIPFIPIIIAGVLAIYGLIYSVIVLQAVTAIDYNTSRGYAQFIGGLVLGFTCLASGIAVGIVGKNGLHAISKNKSSPFRLIINLIYCEALGLYGLIFALIAASAF